MIFKRCLDAVCRLAARACGLLHATASAQPKVDAGSQALDAERQVDPVAPLPTLLSQLESSVHGLFSVEAQRRLEQLGPNRPEAVRRSSPLLDFLRFAANLWVLILLGASLISAFIGEVLGATIIAAIVILSVIVNFVQASRSERTVKMLRESVAATATVLRDRAWSEIARSDVVRGDIVRLSAGDLIPGNARLIESRDLHVQQAALTGESLPVEKSATESAPAAGVSESPNLLFLGTSVVSGTTTGVVFATGFDTAFGDPARRLEEPAPETEFDRGLRRFSGLIATTVFFLVLFILAMNLSLHRNPFEPLLFAVALAVGLTPEFLPIITTVTFAADAVRMARKQVIVKHLAAIQNLGSIDILCTNKTGTITSGEMSLDSWLDPLGEPSERALKLAYLNSRFQTGLKSPLDDAIMKRPCAVSRGCQKTDELPFDFDRRFLSIVFRDGDKYVLITKGAPESVLSVCNRYEIGGDSFALEESSRARSEQSYRKLNERGLEVLHSGIIKGRRAFGNVIKSIRPVCHWRRRSLPWCSQACCFPSRRWRAC